MAEPTEPVAPTPIATVDAKRALADLGEPNKPTVTVPPPPAPAGKLMDKNGQPFDDLRHERDKAGNPKLTAAGSWWPKRGNAARKIAGKPISGAAGKGYVGVLEKPAPADGAATAGEMTAGAAGATVDAMATPMLSEADYEGTAIGLTNGGFSLMKLFFGKAWEPDGMELDTWRGALRRLWFHYELPRVGPLIEVVLLIPATIAKRRDDARTKEGWAKAKAWLGLKPKEPKADDAKAA